MFMAKKSRVENIWKIVVIISTILLILSSLAPMLFMR